MALAFLFIVDPLDELKAYKDTSIAMMREAASRGHEVHACTLDELAAAGGRIEARAHHLLLVPADQSPWYFETSAAVRPLSGFDAVLMRKDPPFDVEFLNATLLLSRAAAQGALVVNDAQALRDHNEKLAILEFPEFTVPALVARDIARLRAFWAEQGDIVVKPLDGLKIAGYVGCQTNRPFGIQGESFENPVYLDKMVETVGGEAIAAYDQKVTCCGGALAFSEPDKSQKQIRDIVESAYDHGAEMIVTPCPLCQANVEIYQGQINKTYGTKFNIPVMYYSQLMVVAYGGSSKEAALNGQVIKARRLEEIAAKPVKR
jgi:hypothetical protein